MSGRSKPYVRSDGDGTGWRNRMGNVRGWNLRGPYKKVLRGEDHPHWRGDDISDRSGRCRARARYVEMQNCAKCDRPAMDRHHDDGNTSNNDPENILMLCRRCHMIADGRLAALKKLAAANSEAAREDPKPCCHCGRPSKGLRHGRCFTCAAYYRRHGTDRPPRLLQRPIRAQTLGGRRGPEET